MQIGYQITRTLPNRDDNIQSSQSHQRYEERVLSIKNRLKNAKETKCEKNENNQKPATSV